MEDMRAPRILVSWYTRPGYIPPFRLSEHQVTIGPSYGDPGEGEVFQAFTPFQRPYDLGALLAGAGIDAAFDAIFILGDASRNNLPMGLERFACPKVLCLGDTHHKEQPLRTLVGYAKMAAFTHVVSSYNRQHLQWFRSAGVSELAWIPGLPVRHMPMPAQPRQPEILFVGNAADTHPWRRAQIDALHTAGLALAAGNAPREVAAELYAKALLGFNCSLNGDLNLRVFEILSGGACLLTDRLAPQSGLSLILEEGRHYVGYDSPDELVDRARFYLANPGAAEAVGAAGAAHYDSCLNPALQRDRLLDWVCNGRLDPQFGADWDDRPALAAEDGLTIGRRIDLYETLQEAHRVRRRLRVLFGPSVPAAYIADAADLVRADLAVLAPGAAAERARPFAPGKAIETLTPDQATRREWDVVVASALDAAPNANGLFPGATVLTV
jgi:hypothetical protein